MRFDAPFGFMLGTLLGLVIVLVSSVAARDQHAVEAAFAPVQTAATPTDAEVPHFHPPTVREYTLINVWHDDVRGVTCWLYPSYGIACLPDASFASTNPLAQ